MKKMAFIAMVVFSLAISAEAARKGSSKKQPADVDARENSEPCATYDCTDERDSEGADDTYVSGSGTYEGNDRDTGSDYINGMPY